MTKELWRIQLILYNILKHNKVAISPASAGVDKFPNIRIITSSVFLK